MGQFKFYALETFKQNVFLLVIDVENDQKHLVDALVLWRREILGG